MKIALLVWLALMASAAPAVAQQQQPELVLGPEYEQRYVELAKWLRDYQDWEKWFEVWGNRIAHNFDDQPVWERKKRPEPPTWLAAECEGYIGGGLLGDACHILRNWDEEPFLILQRKRSTLVPSGGRQDDKVVKSSFFQRVHLSGAWLQAQYPAPSRPVYGIIGMQVGVFETGRFTLPAIGVMLVMMPNGDGGHDWKPATTVGFGYRITDFVAPFIRRPASLHLNIARTNVHGAQDERILPGMLTFNLFGLSVSAKRGR